MSRRVGAKSRYPFRSAAPRRGRGTDGTASMRLPAWLRQRAAANRPVAATTRPVTGTSPQDGRVPLAGAAGWALRRLGHRWVRRLRNMRPADHLWGVRAPGTGM